MSRSGSPSKPLGGFGVPVGVQASGGLLVAAGSCVAACWVSQAAESMGSPLVNRSGFDRGSDDWKGSLS